MEIDRQTFSLSDSGTFGKRALWIGILGLLLSAGGFFINRGHFFHSYLTAFAFWLTLGLGGLFFTMLHHLVAATWSVVFRRIAENIMLISVFSAIFIVVIFAGIGELYHWSHHDLVMQDEGLRGKSVYLNTGFFVLRSIIYFAIWITLAWSLYKTSLKQDRESHEILIKRMRRISGPGMVLFAFTISFAAFDWFMSLNAHWYSTIFGVYIFAGSVLAVLAFMTLLAIYFKQNGPLGNVISPEHFHDLGKLLFTFVVFWGYIAFAQYFLIWYANIPEETIWYHMRWGGWWTAVSLLIIFGSFVFPFVFLISRGPKRNLSAMKFMAFWLLFIHWVDLYWIIMPNHSINLAENLWIDIATMMAIGGFSLWFFWNRLVTAPLVPVNDPNLQASIHFTSE